MLTELNKESLKPTVKHGGGSVIVWAWKSATGVANLVFMDGIMKKNIFLNVLNENLPQSAEKLGLRDDFHFYPDNDPEHKSEIVQTWLIYNCSHLINPFA